MDKSDIRIITDYIDYHYGNELKCSLSYEDYRTRCFSEWAANEILSRVLQETERTPTWLGGDEPMSLYDVIQEFTLEMEEYEYEANTEYVRRIFEIARIEGMCILLDLILREQVEYA